MDPETAPLRFRRPVETGHRRIVALVDDWWGGRHLAHLLPRLWLQPFTGISCIAETAAGSPARSLIGFISPDDPSVGQVHIVATNPNGRRRGLGRELYGRFCEDVAARGERGRQQQARVGHELRPVERGVNPGDAMRRSHPAGAPLRWADGCFATPSLPIRWAPVRLPRMLNHAVTAAIANLPVGGHRPPG